MEGLNGQGKLSHLHHERVWLYHDLDLYIWYEPMKWEGDMTGMGR